eukprot:351080-Rhodomonas_salina.1
MLCIEIRNTSLLLWGSRSNHPVGCATGESPRVIEPAASLHTAACTECQNKRATRPWHSGRPDLARTFVKSKLSVLVRYEQFRIAITCDIYQPNTTRRSVYCSHGIVPRVQPDRHPRRFSTAHWISGNDLLI